MNHGVKCTVCGGLAVLHTKGSLAGFWQCEDPKCGASDAHDHTGEDTRSYEVEVWPTSPEDTGHVELAQFYTVCGASVNE